MHKVNKVTDERMSSSTRHSFFYRLITSGEHAQSTEVSLVHSA
ncbi:hypothetical protein [Priestia koreensis]